MDRAYHDTYYVVAHAHFLWAPLAVAAALLPVWLLLRQRATQGAERRFLRLAFASWALGALLSLAILAGVALLPPHLLAPRLGLVNRAGGLAGLLLLAALLAAVAALIARLLRRRRP